MFLILNETHSERPGLIVEKFEFQYDVSFLLKIFSIPIPGSITTPLRVMIWLVLRFHC